jgi:hypothetical protein
MKECDETEWSLATSRSGTINPSLGDELFGVITPKLLAAIDGPWREGDHGTFRDALSEKGRILDTESSCDGNSGEESNLFTADTVEIGKAIEVAGVHCRHVMS